GSGLTLLSGGSPLRACCVILAQERVAPAGRAAERLVLNHGSVSEQFLFTPLIFEPVISPAPNALEILDFAKYVASAATRAVALIFCTLRFGTQKGNVG